MTKNINAVFEGGGVKGIAFAGAISVVEEQGYQFNNVAGTSAGAIIASLLAAGYQAAQIKDIIETLDYNKFKDRSWLDYIPLLGPTLSLSFEKGIYEAKFIERWLRKLLRDAPNGPVKKFGDLSNGLDYKLQVIASDLTSGKMLVLPQDAVEYGIASDDLSVALAVRMSMSIPFFYEPVKLEGINGKSYIVDGGILSNYPVWLFDKSRDVTPTLGFKLVDSGDSKPNKIRGPISLLTAMFSTMMDAHDRRHVEDLDFKRTIAIPTLGVGTTEFNLSREKSRALYDSGVGAAEAFFEEFD